MTTSGNYICNIEFVSALVGGATRSDDNIDINKLSDQTGQFGRSPISITEWN